MSHRRGFRLVTTRNRAGADNIMSRMRFSWHKRATLRTAVHKMLERLPKKDWGLFVDLIDELTDEAYSTGVRDAITAIRDRRNGKSRLASLRDWTSMSLYEQLSALRGGGSLGMIYPELEDELLRLGHAPRKRSGRPRLDFRARRIETLKNAGKSWAQIARQLSKESGSPISQDACRQLLRNLKKKSTPKG
jgi:hypothetical protein